MAKRKISTRKPAVERIIDRVQQAVRDGKMAESMQLPPAPQLRTSDALLPVNEFKVRR